MTLSIINTSEIASEELVQNNCDDVELETSLTKKWTEYLLSEPEQQINFRDKPSYVQRLSFNNDWDVNYDYMWNASFEWSKLSETIAQLIEWNKKWELVIFRTDDWLEGICHISIVNEVKKQASTLITDDANGKITMEEQLHSEKFSNFICFDNCYFFSTSQDALKYLKRIEETELINEHIKVIKAHPKYIEIQQLTEEVINFLKEKWIDITCLTLEIKTIINKTFWKWQILDEDFDWYNIWLNSNNWYINTRRFCEQDLHDALENKWDLYTNHYWIWEWNFENVAKGWDKNSLERMVNIFTWIYNSEEDYSFSNFTLEQIISDIDNILKALIQNENLTRAIIDKLVLSDFFDFLLKRDDYAVNYLIDLAWNIQASDKVIKKAQQRCAKRNTKQQRKLRKALHSRGLEISEIWKETTEDLKEVYSNWKYVSKYTWEIENWFAPYQLPINFSNNMWNMWFETKELNVYVDPDTYEREYNEILIWESNHNWATVKIWPSNYEWIEWCLYMENLTGIKELSYGNIAHNTKIGSDLFNTYYWNWNVLIDMFRNIESLKWINFHTIFWFFSRINYLEENINTWELARIIDSLKEDINLEQIEELYTFEIWDIAYTYFSEKYPWELTDENYKDFSVRLNDWFHEQISKLLEFANKHL